MIYVVLGQTASGKTKLAIKLAKEFSLPIISADAFQCYKELNIGTDKPSSNQLKGIKHHFINEYSINDDVSVFLFQKEMRKVIDEYISEGKDIIVTGGTLLYIRALLFDYVFIDSLPTKKYDELSLDLLQKELRKRSLKLAEKIDINNPRRIIRTLEKLDSGFSDTDIILKGSDKPIYPCILFNIDIDKEVGNKLIDERVDCMLLKGLKKEATNLLKVYPHKSNGLSAIGYKEFTNTSLSDEEISNLIKTHSHQYAKKQRTFIAHQFDNVIKASSDRIYQLVKQDILLKKRTNLVLDNKSIYSIESSKVLLCGLGGVGSIVATSLVRMGFKDISLIDFDKVEYTNLNRQIMYDLLDIDFRKVDVCKKKMEQVSPLVRVTPYCKKIYSIKDLPADRFDIILDCIDFIDGKVALYLKSKQDSSIFISASGSGFHKDSTKFIYSTLSHASDILSKNFVNKLIEIGISRDEINKINCVYPCDSKVKNKKGSVLVPSICNATNSSGLAIISILLKILSCEE